MLASNRMMVLLGFMGLIAMTGCLGNAPQLKPTLYAGDSANQGISRKQANETIKCTDPKMDDMVCMSYKDLECNFQVYVLGCAKWKTNAFEDANRCNLLKGKSQ